MKKLTLGFIRQRTKEIAGGHECLALEYINAQTKYNNKCDKGHIYVITWNNFQQGRRCPVCWNKKRIKKSPNWRGGVNKSWYTTYAYQINWIEKVRRDPKNKNWLQVKCTNLECKKWFTPKRRNVDDRIKAINEKGTGENRFYCSEECKQSCSIFNQSKYPKGFHNTDNNRPDQNDWAEMVKERDNHECQRCGCKKDIIAHHIEGLNVNPIMSADIDMGITLCKKCDKLAHSEIGCRPVDLTKRELCN